MVVWNLTRTWLASRHLRGGFCLLVSSSVVPHRKQMVNLQVKLRVAVLSSDIFAPTRPPCPPLTTQLQKQHVWNLRLLGKPFFALLCSFTTHPFGEGMKACSLPPPQNISNFHLSLLRITCLSRAGVQAVLICLFARTLCKQSSSYLLCEEWKKKMTLLR